MPSLRKPPSKKITSHSVELCDCSLLLAHPPVGTNGRLTRCPPISISSFWRSPLTKSELSMYGLSSVLCLIVPTCLWTMECVACRCGPTYFITLPSLYPLNASKSTPWNWETWKLQQNQTVLHWFGNELFLLNTTRHVPLCLLNKNCTRELNVIPRSTPEITPGLDVIRLLA